MRVLAVIAALTVIPAQALVGQGNNAPWYPSLMAFEHYDSLRLGSYPPLFTGQLPRLVQSGQRRQRPNLPRRLLDAL